MINIEIILLCHENNGIEVITDNLKGTLMQIWKSANIFIFTWKEYVEDIRLKHLLRPEICAREICEKFVYKHLQRIEYVKN